MSRKNRKGTRKSDINKSRGRGSLRGKLFTLAKKFGLIACIFIFIAWLAAWFFLSGVNKRSWNFMQQKIVSNAAEQGVRVENILIEGRENTDIELLKAIINTQEGDPLLDFQPESVQPLIQKISWVKNAKVMRRMPDTIHVIIEEYEPLALWQHNEKVVVIGEDGTVLTDELSSNFEHLIILTGQKAPENALELILLLQAEPILYQKIAGAMLVNDRRWDLKLSNGKTVSLPDSDIGFALRRLAQAQEENQILEKDIQRIDLREPDRIIVEGK